MAEVRCTPTEDLERYLEIRNAAARYMVANGIVQWVPDELTPARLRQWIGDGTLFFGDIDGVIVGGFFVIWSDPLFWDGDDAPAGYLHGLVIDRRFKGQGVGRQMLTHAEQYMAANGKPRARLDTAAHSSRLRAYYRDAGYRELREKHFADGVFDHGPDLSVILFEKELS
mgnify:CR=1 FL=1